MPSDQYNWDFFIAHAGPDKRTAEKLYYYLKPESSVFLDSRDLNLGDNWHKALPRAQQSSLVTVVLISSKTEEAYYEQEEIAAAIDLSRKNAEKHRVVPVFLDRKASNDNVPYGLRLLHGVTVSRQLSLKRVAEKLLELLSSLVVSSGPALVTETTDGESQGTPSKPVHQVFPQDLVDFEGPQNLFKGMLTDSREKRLMFIKALGGRGKSSFLRMLGFHCEEKGVPYCSIDFHGQPYDNPHVTLAHVICTRLRLSPRHLAQALQPLSTYRHEGEIDEPYIVSQILAGVNVTHEGLRQPHIKELLKNAFLGDLNEFVEQKGCVVCLFDSFERLSEEEQHWLLETLLKPVKRGELQNVMVVTAGEDWPDVPRWEWEQHTHLLNPLPLLKAEHIKTYAEKRNIEITDEQAEFCYRLSAGIPLHVAMMVDNLGRPLSEVA